MVLDKVAPSTWQNSTEQEADSVEQAQYRYESLRTRA
jgi:hypothetical protein